MKKKIIIFKNDGVGDLVHSVPAIKDIISQNLDKEVVIFLSKNSEKFYFLFENNNSQLKVLNYHLTAVEKIKIFFYLFSNKVEKVYILSPKNFYFFLPLFFLKTKFFGLCVNGVRGNKRPYLFLRKFLYKFVINDRETTKKRKPTRLLQFELVSKNKFDDINFNFKLDILKSDKLKKYLPNDYLLVHYKKFFFEELSWGVKGLEKILIELKRHNLNIVLTKDIEIDQNNIIFRDKYNTYDFKTNKFYDNASNVLFLDNICGADLYNVIKYSKKVIAIHGMMTNLAYLCKKPVLDLFHCVIKNKANYHSYKNAFYEFKPNYLGYDFIIPSKNIEKTIKKMKFSLTDNI